MQGMCPRDVHHSCNKAIFQLCQQFDGDDPERMEVRAAHGGVDAMKRSELYPVHVRYAILALVARHVHIALPSCGHMSHSSCLVAA